MEKPWNHSPNWLSTLITFPVVESGMEAVLVTPHWKWDWEVVTWVEMSSGARSDLVRKYNTVCC